MLLRKQRLLQRKRLTASLLTLWDTCATQRRKSFSPHVLVEVLGTKISVTTDVTGHFMLKNLPVGKLRVRVAVPGFEPQIHEITTTSDATLVSDFEIVPNDV